jgi:hypothetical protein
MFWKESLLERYAISEVMSPRPGGSTLAHSAPAFPTLTAYGGTISAEISLCPENQDCANHLLNTLQKIGSAHRMLVSIKVFYCPRVNKSFSVLVSLCKKNGRGRKPFLYGRKKIGGRKSRPAN